MLFLMIIQYFHFSLMFNFWKSFFPYFLAFFLFNSLVCHVLIFGRPCFDVYFEPRSLDTGHMKVDDSVRSAYLQFLSVLVKCGYLNKCSTYVTSTFLVLSSVLWRRSRSQSQNYKRRLRLKIL